MKRRWQLGLGLILFLGIFCFGTWLLLRPPSLVNTENFMKIQGGMAEAEVEAILGLPSGRGEECRSLMDPVIGDLIKGVTKRQMSSREYSFNNSASVTQSLWLQGEIWI